MATTECKIRLVSGEELTVKLLYTLEQVYIVHDIVNRAIKIISKSFVDSVQKVK